MVLWLASKRRPLSLDAAGSLPDRRMGNPKAQARTVARMRRLSGDSLLHADLTAGSRGRYSLQVVSWFAFCPRTWTALLDEDAPQNAWVCVGEHVRAGRGGQDRSTLHLIVTRHCLERAIERAGVRDVAGVLRLLRELWKSTAPLEAPACEWFVPIAGDGVAVLVHDPKTRALLAKTTLERAKVDPAALQRTEAAIAAARALLWNGRHRQTAAGGPL